jgi:predicted nucleic acid-binding protein
MAMKVLLDTNIVIHRENVKVSNPSIGLLFYWLDKLHYEKCVHPWSVEELKSYKDKNMQELYETRLPAYTILKSVSVPQEEFLAQLPKEESANDKIDHQLLCEVFNSRVDLLITEDRKLREKAQKLGIGQKVYSINEFVSEKTEEFPELISYKMLSVKRELFGDIDLNDVFFDSLKEAYPDFISWFNKKSEEEAYVCRTDEGVIKGFLYIKTEDQSENYSSIEPIFLPKKRLKVGTFKVDASGFRLGERFIKIIFDNALYRKVDEIYVTFFEDSPNLDALKGLLETWGFVRHGIKHSYGKEETVFVKKLGVMNPEMSAKNNFPNMQFGKQKFILPIMAKYHTSLLPDSILKTEKQINFMGPDAQKYALQKVYISWAPERNINPGDLILFYRMGEEGSNKKYSSVLTTLGMVDRIYYNFKTRDDFLKHCQNRSVFSKAELDDFWNKHQYHLMVLKFVFVRSLKSRLTLDYLHQLGVVEQPKGPRPFMRVSDDIFKKILLDSKTNIKFVEA